MIEDNTRLHPSEPFRRVELPDLIDILRPVHDDGDIAGLTCQTGSATAREDRSAEAAASGNSGYRIIDGPRDHHSDRYLPVVGAIRGLECATAHIEANFTVDIPFQRGCKCPRVSRPLGRPTRRLDHDEIGM